MPVSRGATSFRVRFAAPSELEPIPENGTWVIKTKSASDALFPAVTVARFDHDAASGAIRFRWLTAKSTDTRTIEAVRDAILEIGGPDAAPQYALLRNPEVCTEATELRPGPQRRRRDRGTPSDSFTWAKKTDALKGTAWDLGIRAFQVTYEFAGSEKTFGRETGSQSPIARAFTIEVIRGECQLNISLEETWSIRVVRESGGNALLRNLTVMERVLDKHRVSLRDVAPGLYDQREPAKLQRELADLQAALDNGVGKLAEIRSSPDELASLKRAISCALIDNFVENARVSRIALVIGLRLDNHTILDIARIGKQDKSEPQVDPLK
jgi:hypothetical protein